MEKKTEDLILEELKSIKNDIKEFKTDNEQNFKIIFENLESLNRSVLLLETQHGEQLKVLFDARSLNLDTKDIQDSRLSLVEKIVDNHGVRLNNLEIKTCVI